MQSVLDHPSHSSDLAHAPKASEEVDALHRRCGVYTKAPIVQRILDAVGWRADADLTACRLLEPSCGDGAFVGEAARRLVRSFSQRRVPLTTRTLRDRIRAFELHPREVERARKRVIEALRSDEVHHRTAAVCAEAWVTEGDFLLSDLRSATFTHAVGNPPYVRWSRIPVALKENYERCLSRNVVGGDLMLPFLDRALDLLSPAGRFGFICSDRWRYMAFAEAFRQKWLPQMRIHSERAITAADAFVDAVDSYPTILIASKVTPLPANRPAVIVKAAGKTLAELGCAIKVGPALGHTPAFVLGPEEQDVEPELLQPWIDGSEIDSAGVTWKGRRIIMMYDSEGKLLDLKRFPRLEKRLKRFREQLQRRSIVLNGAPWYRPIDRFVVSDWSRPKLVVPELASVPRVAIDESGAVPSHGVYAIFAPDDDVARIYEKLKGGKLAAALEGIAPRVNGGFVRCYKRFLLMARFQK